MRTGYPCICLPLIVIAQLGFQHSAVAQPSVADKAAAQVLFDSGRKLLQEGNYAQACKRLEQSQAIEPGIGNLLYLADCYEHIDRTASAWALFIEAASRAAAVGESERARIGRRRADSLKESLSSLTLEVPQPHVLPGLEVARNGVQVPASLWGVSVPVDPGDYNIVARAPGRIVWSSSVHVGASAARASMTIPLLSEEPVSAAARPPAVETRVLAPANTLPLTAAGHAPLPTGGSFQRVLGASLAGVGGVAIIVGAVFGGRAIAKNDEAKRLCPDAGPICDDITGVELTRQADSAATAANVLMIGGAALFAGGAIVYLTSPTSSERSGLALALGASSLRLTLTERF